MSLKAKRKVVSSIPPMDGGTYMGVCVAVVDLGQQYKQFEKQKQGKYAEECMFIFEIPNFCYNIPNNRRIVGVNNAVNMPLRVNPKLAYAPYLLLISIAVEVPTA